MNTTEIHLIICLFVFYFVIAIEHPEELVNLLAGSFTDGQRFSTGNTLPLVGRPWGFNHWAPQTIETGRSGSSWWFQGNEHMMTWLRCTHQPSPWIGDWGYFLVSPQVGNVQQNPHHFWEPRGAVLKPYLFDAIVAPFNIRIELTPTDHAAYLRVTFPESSEHGEKHICFSEARWDSNANNAKDGSKVITGRAVQVHSERMAVTNFNMHIRVESKEATSVTNQADLKCFAFARDASVVHVRMATSLISADQAAVNLNRELRMGKPFDDVLLESKMVWNKLMRRVDVVEAGDVSESTNRHLSVFYTGLYRGLMFPRRIDEITAAGKVVHYSPYDPHGGVHEGVLVTDNGFWDTFRTVYPMLSLIYPDHLGVLVQGWLNAFKEGGWLPSWASPGYRNCMVGTFADVVVADAIVKGVRGFDLDTAREAILKDSFEEAPRYVGSAAGKEGLSEYSSKGYLAYSNGGGEVVSRTLDYGFADYSTAQALLVLAEKDELLGDELRRKAKTLLARATAAYTNLFDKNHGLMVPKNRDGGFSPSFSSIEWGNGYTEGNSWHHSFPPYAIIDSAGSSNLRSGQSVIEGGLVTLYGGKKPLLARLHQMLKTSSNFRVGSYGNEIHEMTEARAVAMGQYGHNNQPSHHILYLFALLGERRTTEELVRRVMDRAYGMDFFAGDEDNGEMGSWFVLSALGLYVVVPGTRDYVLGSPLFRHVRINRDAEVPLEHYYEEKYVPADSSPKQYLDIFALGTSASVLHVESVQLNERRVDGATVDDASLQRHGFIRFVMEGESTGADEVAALHATTSFPGAAAAVARRGSVADQPRPSDVSVETHLKEQLLAQASTIKRLSAQLQSQQGGESQMTNTPDRTPRYSVLSVAFTLLLVLVLAFCLSKLLEMLGVFSGSSELAADSHSSHKALSLNDFNSPLRGAATREPSSNYGTSSRNVFFTCYLYSCSMCRSCALWLSSDSISSTVAGGSAATNVAMIKWGKAQSHTV